MPVPAGSLRFVSPLTRVAVCIALGGLVLPPASASAAQPVPERARKCASPISLSTSIAWDHSDPLYMFLDPEVVWRNCRGKIRQVTLELRQVDSRNGHVNAWSRSYIPDLRRKAYGAEKYTEKIGLTGSASPQSVEFHPTVTSFQSCTTFTTGAPVAELGNYKWYTVARAFDDRGRELIQKVSPTVVCDQNG